MKLLFWIIYVSGFLFSLCGSAKKTHGLIWLDGLFGIPGNFMGQRIDICNVVKKALDLSDSVEVCCPVQPMEAVYLHFGTWPAYFGLSEFALPSWFDMNMHSLWLNYKPSDVPTESIGDLDNSSKSLDFIVQEMVEQGIPQENIVVAGYSQGGALAFYNAIHTNYKLGGIVALCSWMPNLLTDPPSQHGTINTETPVLQVHGLLDTVVLIPTAYQTSIALREMFTDYTFKTVPFTGHFTTINPFTILSVKSWLKKKNLLSFNS